MKHLKKLNNSKQLFGRISLLTITTMLSFSSQAASLTTFRIYLDEETRNNSFVVFNDGTEAEKCHLSLAHNNFDDEGNMSKYQGDKLPDNSAKNWIRFAPKRFTLTAAKSQTVRFSMRRKANAKAAEYRSFLRVDCSAVDRNPENKQVSVSPRLVHNVPVVVRMGKLDATMSFADFSLDGDFLTFKILRSGTRSTYGKVALFNKETGEMLSSQSGLSIYPESSSTEFVLSTRGQPVSNLVIKYLENTGFGGNKEAQQEVVLAK